MASLRAKTVGALLFQVSDVHAKLSRDRLSSVQASIGSVQVRARDFFAVVFDVEMRRSKATQAL